MAAEPEATFELHLEDDDEEESRLASSQFENMEEEERLPRGTVTWKSALSDTFRVIINSHKPKKIVWNEVEACLLIFKIDFIAAGGSRFHGAHLEVSIVDESAATNDLNGPLPSSAQANRPFILDYAPQVYYQAETEEPRAHDIGGNLGAGDPTNTVNAGLSNNQHVERRIHYRQKIHGADQSTRCLHMITWSITENQSVKRGLYESFCVAIVVQHRPNRRFAAKIEGWFKTYMPFRRPVFGKHDAPVYCDPATLPLDTEAYDVAKLRSLTGLAGYGGRFIK